MKKDKKATIAETIFVIGIPFISAATMVFKDEPDENASI